MSYDFTGGNRQIDGSFNSTYTVPLTLAAWIKHANHPVSNQYAVTLHKDANLDEFVSLQVASTDDRYQAMQADATTFPTANYAAGAGEYDGVWLPIVCTFESTTVFNVFVESISNTTERSGAAVDPGTLGQISLGEAQSGGGDFTGLLAEVAIWNTELSNDDITRFLGGTPASSIDPSNLIGYWPLDADNATQSNEGTDLDGDLTVASAVYSADHPTLSSSTVPVFIHHRRLLGMQ